MRTWEARDVAGIAAVKFHEALARAVESHGVDTLFGLIGDANLYWVDTWVRRGAGSYVAAANEGGAVLMANGYACTSGKVGVATITHGPALTNVITALVEGVKNRTSLVLIAGDTAVTDREHLQDVDQRALIMATGAGFEPVRSPATLGVDLALAFRRAIAERRPIVLDVPADFMWLDVDDAPVAPTPVHLHAVLPDPARLDDAVGIIASVRRPIVLAGRGATGPECRTALAGLAARIGAPLATTLNARDLFRGEPFDLGIFGTLSEDAAAEVILESDCIIAFGASLARRTTTDGSFVQGKAVVQIDIDPTRLGRLTNIDAGVVGDTVAVATAIVDLLDAAEIEPTSFRSESMQRRLDEAAATSSPPGDSLDIATVVAHLERIIPADRTLVSDAGRFCYEPLRRMHVPTPSALVPTFAFGSIGLGMGNAIGAWFGAPHRLCVLVCGDGGFMLGGLTEFNTAVRAGADLVVVVFNDGSYGAEHVQFVNRGLDPSLALLDWPGFADVAIALGGTGVTVQTVDDLALVDAAIADRDRPVLIDVRLDPEHVPSRR